MEFGIGDTLTDDPAISLSRDSAVCARSALPFCTIPNPGKFKQFRQGVEHSCSEEGVVQVFELRDSVQKRFRSWRRSGPRQFEGVQYRLESEYGAPSTLRKNASWGIISLARRPERIWKGVQTADGQPSGLR